MAIALLAVIRPVSGWLTLLNTDLDHRSRAVVSAYGLRGIGSIYYLRYVGNQLELVNENQLWLLVGLVILLLAILHGFSVGWAMDKLKKE